MNALQLKDYIEKVYMMERQKYTLQEAINVVTQTIHNRRQLIKDLENAAPIPLKKYDDSSSDGLGLGVVAIAIFLFYVGGMIGWLLDAKSIIAALIYLLFWPLAWLMSPGSYPRTITAALIGLGIALVGGFVVFIISIHEEGEEHKRIKLENEKIKQKNEIIKKNNQIKINEINSEIENVLMQEKQKLEQLYYQTNNVLQQYYAKEIIGEKYRGLIPVSSFYEYLKYGRCISLEAVQGYDGAYNIYESERRLNRIITELQDIKDNLKQVQENQIMLYHTIKSANAQNAKLFNGLSNQMQKISNNLASIEQNQEVLSYNMQCVKQAEEWNNYLMIMQTF